MSSSAEAGTGPAGLFPDRVVATGWEGARRRGALLEADATQTPSALARAPGTGRSPLTTMEE